MIESEYCNILEELIIPEMASDYIKKSSNLTHFIQCVIRDNPKWMFDYSDILDIDFLEIMDCEEIDENIKITFGFSYILTLWFEKRQLARVTAVAKGSVLCPVLMPPKWKEIDWDNLNKYQILEQAICVKLLYIQNMEEEYDDTSFL